MGTSISTCSKAEQPVRNWFTGKIEYSKKDQLVLVQLLAMGLGGVVGLLSLLFAVSKRTRPTFALPNVFIALTNLLFFSVIQYLFFEHIASKQYNVLIKEKLGIIRHLTGRNPELRKAAKRYVQRNQSRLQAASKIQADKRASLNWDQGKSSIFIYSGVVVGLLSLVGLLILVKGVRTRKLPFSLTDGLLLMTVLGAFTTELLYFFGVVQRYEIYGDHEIIKDVFEAVLKHKHSWKCICYAKRNIDPEYGCYAEWKAYKSGALTY